MARRRRGLVNSGSRDETEMSPLLNDDDETPTNEAGFSAASNKQLRFMVLGGDDALMDKACATILGERENRDAFQFGELIPRKAKVCGQQVSVLKTPFTWLKHLKSYFFFSNGVKSLKNDLQNYESQLFPGPHGFLLVHRDVKNSGRENYLLHALSNVFGEKVLDYCMVLFIDVVRNKNPRKNYCLKMCGGRYHILQNTDESVDQLFKKTKAMTQFKSSAFFTNHLECFRKAENYFGETIENLKEEMNVMKEHNAREVTKLKERIKDMSKESKNRESRLCNEMDAFKIQTKKDFPKLDERIKDEVKKLPESKERESQLCNEMDQSECTIIQREEQVQVKEKELHKKQRELDDRQRNLDDRQRNLDDRQRNLDDRQRNLDERQNQLEMREREVRQRDPGSSEHHQSTSPSVSGDKNSPLDECEGELKSGEHSQAGESHGIHKPVRRNSKELEPPEMSESRPLHTL
ncbi:uncharacterized protein [Garra rufa]|uniref:uncharacterized protein n=1 Tax=Garra rufa TaxID=137080 RepID=UPI003CCEEC85